MCGFEFKNGGACHRLHHAIFLTFENMTHRFGRLTRWFWSTNSPVQRWLRDKTVQKLNQAKHMSAYLKN